MAAGLGTGFTASTENLSKGPMSDWPHVYSLHPERDGSLWIPASLGGELQFYGGTWTNTRNAAGDYDMARSAGAGTSQIVCNLSKVFQKILGDPTIPGTAANQLGQNLPGGGQAHILRGMQVVGFDLVYILAVADATSITPTPYQVPFVNGQGAPAPVVMGGVLTPATLSVAHGANVIVASQVFGTPWVIGANTADVMDTLEIVAVLPGTTTMRVYGVNLYFNYTFL